MHWIPSACSSMPPISQALLPISLSSTTPAGARALGLLHRLRQTTHASSPEMRLCERRAGDSAGRGRRRRGARGDAQRVGNDHRASPGPRKPRDASPRRRLDGHGLGGHDANRRDRRRSGRGERGRAGGRGARASSTLNLPYTRISNNNRLVLVLTPVYTPGLGGFLPRPPGLGYRPGRHRLGDGAGLTPCTRWTTFPHLQTERCRSVRDRYPPYAERGRHFSPTRTARPRHVVSFDAGYWATPTDRTPAYHRGCGGPPPSP